MTKSKGLPELASETTESATTAKSEDESRKESPRADGAQATGDGSEAEAEADPFEAHLADLEGEARAEEPKEDPAAGLIDRDTFWHGFRMCHEMPGALLGLSTLRNGPNSPGARKASDAIYDCIIDTPALHFLLSPGNIWIQRAMAIGAYTVPIAIASYAEWGANRAREEERRKSAAARRAQATREAASDAAYEDLGAADGAA